MYIYSAHIPDTMSSALRLSDGVAFTDPNYHPAVAGPNDTFLGKTWQDMPGTDIESKRMNFFLFRRGLYEMPSERKDINRFMRAGCRRKRRAA